MRKTVGTTSFNALTAITIAPICVSALLLSAPANAQLALEEVIVTAQKKEESLQDTPIALDAFGEDDLENKGISNVGDLANNVPALTIEPFPINNTTLRIYIRGIGLIDAQVTQDPPVGVYIDGAYIARSSGLATDVADLVRIEVLRGPQGTLYGRNSTGGAVNLVTKRPNVDEQEFVQKFTVGNRALFTSKTSFNQPLWQGAAVKGAYYTKQIDGYIDNKGPGGDYGDNETQGYRVDFGWDINDHMRVDYAWDRSEVEHYNASYSMIAPPLDIPPDPNSPTAQVNQLINTGASQFFDYNTSGNRPSNITSAVPILQSDTDIEGHQIQFTWSISDTLEFKYIYAERELFDGSAIDLGSGPRTDGYRLDNNAIFSFAVPTTPGSRTPSASDFANLTTGNLLNLPAGNPRSVQYNDTRPELSQEQYSHEFQLTGDLFDGQISYITGLYLFHEEGIEDNGEVHHQLSGPLGSNEAGNNTGLRIETLTQQVATIDNDAAAIFTQITWRPSWFEERLSFTLGARHSEDERKATLFRRLTTFAVTPAGSDNLSRNDADTGQLFQDAVIDGNGSKKFQDDSFGLTVEFALSDEINLYLKQNEAYKSGGFNIREVVNEDGQRRFDNGFDEEKVTSIELGMKAQFFENRLRINADIFQTEFVDQQLNFSVPNSLTDTTVANAGASELKGFEADTTFLAAQGLILIFNYAYLDSSIDPSINPLTGEVDNGFVFNSTPRHAYTFVVDWSLAQTDYGRVALNTVYSFTDERNGGGRKGFATFDADKQDDFAIFNARIGLYEIPLFEGEGTVALWGRNLFDEDYTVNNIHNLPQSSKSSLYGEPRTWGMDFIYRLSR